MTVSTSCIQFSDGSIDSAAVAEIADNRAVIDQAKGMLILLYGVDDESAFDMLRRRSQSTNVKLRALAGQLVSDYRALSDGEALPPRWVYEKTLMIIHERIARDRSDSPVASLVHRARRQWGVPSTTTSHASHRQPLSLSRICGGRS